MVKVKKLKQMIKKLGIDIDNYPDEALEFIYDNFCFYEEDFKVIPDIILQLKSGLSLIRDDENLYLKFIKHLAQKNLLSGNILEVGCGYYPALAQKLIQIPSVKSVTVMDPNLTIDKLSNLRLVKAEFTQAMDITGYDTIIGFKPCDATTSIIQAANEQSLPFSVVLCECTHFENPYMHMPLSIEKWRDYTWKIANDKLDRNSNLEESFLENEPIPNHYTLTKTYQKNQ